MRVMAVDPGLTRCGVAVVDVARDRRVQLVVADVVRTPSDADIGTRLVQLESALESVFSQYQPDVMAVERVFSQHNVRTVVGTAQAAAVATLIAARRGVDVVTHTPTEVKAAVTGSGRADKKQVALMVDRITGRSVIGPADVTDAVALAICHGWRTPIPVQVGAR